jgi:hypothetical protein
VDGTTDDTRRDRLELFSAILLGLAALTAAFTAYRAALSDGDAVQGYSTAIQELSDANFFYAQGNQVFAQDNQLFLTYVQASQAGNTDLEGYILTQLMRPELSDAVEWWLSTDAVTPFDDDEDNPYTIAEYGQAQEFEDRSLASFQEASDADETGDTYELAGVLLAIALFLGGIVSFFRRTVISNVLLAMGTAAVIGGIVLAVTG